MRHLHFVHFDRRSHFQSCCNRLSWPYSAAARSDRDHDKLEMSTLTLASLSDTQACNACAGLTGDTFCQGKTAQFYADPCDCTKFVQCSNGITYLENCGSGTMWNEASLTCVAGSCSTTSTSTPAATPATTATTPTTTSTPTTTGTCAKGTTTQGKHSSSPQGMHNCADVARHFVITYCTLPLCVALQHSIFHLL